jgi:hypothetical protein
MARIAGEILIGRPVDVVYSAGDAVTGPDLSPICVAETGTESA